MAGYRSVVGKRCEADWCADEHVHFRKANKGNGELILCGKGKRIYLWFGGGDRQPTCVLRGRLTLLALAEAILQRSEEVR